MDDQIVPPTNGVMEVKPSLKHRFYRFLGFKSSYVESPDQLPYVRIGLITTFSYLDRIRILFSGKAQTALCFTMTHPSACVKIDVETTVLAPDSHID